MSGVLRAIVETKKAEVERLAAAPPRVRVQGGPRRNVVEALRRPAGAPLRLIAEIKRKSPSAGALSTKLSAPDRALAYAEAGASMISVLTDETYFGGGWADLADVRGALDAAGRSVPLLAKEFVIDARQLAEAAASGADAALLIARIVDRASLVALAARARELGLEPFVEVVTEEELAWALEADARVVGVNARDLDTLAMDADHAARVLAAIPADRVAVHLSGLKGPADIAAIAASRADAALVGETLMREDDPRPKLSSMVAAARR